MSCHVDVQVFDDSAGQSFCLGVGGRVGLLSVQLR